MLLGRNKGIFFGRFPSARLTVHVDFQRLSDETSFSKPFEGNFFWAQSTRKRREKRRLDQQLDRSHLAKMKKQYKIQKKTQSFV